MSSRRILTFPEYAAIRHPTPYVVDVRRNASRLVLFGGFHSSDPTLPMFDRIASAFAELGPDFALHEGTPPHPEADRETAIRRHGEAGLVTHLAAGRGIATASMDVPLADEARLLRHELSEAETLVFLVVRQLASFNRKTARMDFDGYFGDFFALIAPALGRASIDWPLVETAHHQVAGRPLEVRRVTARETDPMRDDLVTQRIARRSNRLRDEYMLDRLLAALERHRQVFAVVGVSHAVMLEPALRDDGLPSP